jgi:DNA polymerase-4
MSNDRQVVHLDLDSFFVSVELLKNSSLIGKPVIVGGSGDRSVVASCSYEARKFGIHSAMPGRMAKQLCPHAIFIRGNMDEYAKYSEAVTKLLQEYAPILEKASIDEHYIDVSGMDKFIGCIQWTKELQQKVVKETGLPISFGLSINKTVAKVATNEGKPKGSKIVSLSEVQPFLNPLHVRKLPGIGDQATITLQQMGVHFIEVLSKIPALSLQKVFGKPGFTMWQKARGIDDTPVTPYEERKSISAEETFETDTIDMVQIRQILTRMVLQLAFQLRIEKKVTACINVKLRYSDFETVNKQTTISYTAMDDILIAKTHFLFDALYEKRKLIRLVGVKFTRLISGYEQIDLFDVPGERYNLTQAMDYVRQRFGNNAVTLASTLK